jgi:diguanylate cyclase (GGDEF)-like protein
MDDVFFCISLGGWNALLGIALTTLLSAAVQGELAFRRTLLLNRLGLAAMLPLVALGPLDAAGRAHWAPLLMSMALAGAAMMGWGLRDMNALARKATVEASICVLTVLVPMVSLGFGMKAYLLALAGVSTGIGSLLFTDLAVHFRRHRKVTPSEWGQLLSLAVFTLVFGASGLHTLLVPTQSYPAYGLNLPAWAATPAAIFVASLPFMVIALALAIINERLLERLSHEALIDELSGLPSRRGLRRMASHLLNRRRSAGHDVAVIMLDIDHFKVFNDTYGHDTGDQVLAHVSAILRQSLRPEALLGRVGGEEFAAVVPIRQRHDARAVAERLREAAEAHPLRRETGDLGVTISLGVSFVGNRSLTDAMKEADAALYAAKRGGRNRVAVATELSRVDHEAGVAGAKVGLRA